nr:hypothetical protein [Pseudomonas syringae]
MGEWSKKLGERGEHITESLLNLIGWKAALKGHEFDCVKPVPHSTTDNPRKTHGADFVFSCLSPLEDGILKHLVISSKFTSGPYPTSPGPLFKDHFTDLARTVECFNRSPLKKSINSGYTGASAQSLAGILCWFSPQTHDQLALGSVGDFLQMGCAAIELNDLPVVVRLQLRGTGDPKVGQVAM